MGHTVTKKGEVWVMQKVFIEVQTNENISVEDVNKALFDISEQKDLEPLFAPLIGGAHIDDWYEENGKFVFVKETTTQVEGSFYIGGHIGPFDPPDSYAPEYELLESNCVAYKGEEMENKAEFKAQILTALNKKFNGAIVDVDFYGEDIDEKIYKDLDEGDVYYKDKYGNSRTWFRDWTEEDD